MCRRVSRLAAKVWFLAELPADPLLEMSKKEEKASYDAANYERQRTQCIVVTCDEVA